MDDEQWRRAMAHDRLSGRLQIGGLGAFIAVVCGFALVAFEGMPWQLWAGLAAGIALLMFSLVAPKGWVSLLGAADRKTKPRWPDLP